MLLSDCLIPDKPIIVHENTQKNLYIEQKNDINISYIGCVILRKGEYGLQQSYIM